MADTRLAGSLASLLTDWLAAWQDHNEYSECVERCRGQFTPFNGIIEYNPLIAIQFFNHSLLFPGHRRRRCCRHGCCAAHRSLSGQQRVQSPRPHPDLMNHGDGGAQRIRFNRRSKSRVTRNTRRQENYPAIMAAAAAARYILYSGQIYSNANKRLDNIIDNFPGCLYRWGKSVASIMDSLSSQVRNAGISTPFSNWISIIIQSSWYKAFWIII